MSKPRRVALMLDLTWLHKRHTGVFAGAQKYAQERGWESVIDEYADHTLLRASEKPAPYDGIIARATRKLAGRAARRGVPLVNVWASSPAGRSLPGVFPDFLAIGRLCAEHLLSRGFYRFATLANENDRGQSLVQKGFVRTVAEAGYRCVPITTPLDATACLRDWLRKERTVAAWVKNWEPPIGVWVGLEDDGRMVTQICRSHGLRVPDDVAIIAGSNEETLCEHIQPTLTSVEVGYERIGYEAARLLDGLMDGQPQGTQTAPRTRPEPLLLPPKCLVVRESTDFFAVDNELVAAALQFIAANSHLPIQADDVARAVATEKRTLRNYFRKHLDRSIAAEVRRVRIERAKRELAQTERSIKDISRAVGFGPAMRMNETFLRELGLTPGDYRRQRRT